MTTCESAAQQFHGAALTPLFRLEDYLGMVTSIILIFELQVQSYRDIGLYDAVHDLPMASSYTQPHRKSNEIVRVELWG
jgi:hypothetical protein